MTTSIQPLPESCARRFEARFEALPVLLAAATAACSAAGLGSDVTRHVELVLEEAFSNTIRHGYGSESASRFVWLAARPGPDGLRLIYEDAATPFDPLLAASLPGDGRVGGLGCLLIKTLPKRAEYRRSDGRNILSFDFLPRA